MKKIALAASLALLVGLALPAGYGSAAAPSEGCGTTTIDGTVDFSLVEEGAVLKCGPGQRVVVRDDFVKPKAKRAKTRRALTSFLTIADVQLADEESPLRAEWADKCEQHPGTAAFRPHETMVPYLMNAHVRAANEIVRTGSPVLNDAVSFAFALGDLADNNHLNELRWIIDIMDGDKLVNPDSGEDGYDGLQGTDPTGAPSDPLAVPVEGTTLRDLANEPFWALGLQSESDPFPWYSLPGNHDVKVQGTVPNTENWRTFANSYATGSLKFTDVPPDQQQRACQAQNDPAKYQELVTNPGGVKVVPADEDRRLLSREEWVQEHFKTSGVPVGHGYDTERCHDAEGKLLERACYSWKEGRFHYIALDSNPDEGLEDGNIDLPQWKWLKHELRESSRKHYVKGEVKIRKKAKNRLIVVFSHHPGVSMNNTSTENARNEAQLRKLFLRFPNVILHSAGHTHQNKVWGHKSEKLGTSYWEVNTAAIVDFPQQSRSIEIADNNDGTISIFAIVFDAAMAPNARTVDWAADDPTSEKALGGADSDINEDWLAAAGLEIGAYDPQADLTKIGTPKDRNVELLLKAPFKL